MEISPLVTHPVLLVGPEHSLMQAARRMQEKHIGSAIVETENGYAIITERDLLRAISEGEDLNKAKVGEYMTSAPVTVTRNAGVEEAATKMIEGGFRHLIVLDEEGWVDGMLSIRDLVPALLRMRSSA